MPIDDNAFYWRLELMRTHFSENSQLRSIDVKLLNDASKLGEIEFTGNSKLLLINKNAFKFN